MPATLAEEYINLRKKALEKYFGGLNGMQMKAVFKTEGPLLILAGAGSGKTTVLIRRIENMVKFGRAYELAKTSNNITQDDISRLQNYINGSQNDMDELKEIIAEEKIKPWNILAITFTNKAAGEIKERLFSQLGSIAGDINAYTFHSMCVRILRRDIKSIGYNSNFAIYDQDDSLRIIKEAFKACGIDDKAVAPRAALSAISKAKDSLTGPEEFLANADGDFYKASIAKVYKYYENTLKSANALDFDDILLYTLKIFEEFPEKLEYYQNRFKYIMVDEYQDTNNVQFRLVHHLSKGHKNLCVVGDDDQSIYKFRGATIENILNFESQFKDAIVIRLEQNYRSTQNILNAANEVISNNTARKGKNLWTDIKGGEKINVVIAKDELEEAKTIAEDILKNVAEGARYGNHAILYRVNSLSNTLELGLSRNAIPYRIIGGLRFYERKEIKDIIAYLSVIENTNDTLRLMRIINEPKRGIGNSTVESVEKIAVGIGESPYYVISHADEFEDLSRKSIALKDFAALIEYFRTEAGSMPLDRLFDEVTEKTGYMAMLDSQGFEGAGRKENLLELKSNIINYMQSTETPSLSEFLEEITLFTDLDNYNTDNDAVILMTVHSAKGLEFDNVYIAGMDDGVFPSKRSFSYPEEIEEERRLAYVAITRAKKKLSILTSERRLLFGKSSWGQLSRFAKEIPQELVEYLDKAQQHRSRSQKMVKPKPEENTSATAIGVGSYVKSKSDSLDKGDKVSHPTFGDGVVVLARPMGGDILLEIDFKAHGIKRLMSNYANIKKM